MNISIYLKLGVAVICLFDLGCAPVYNTTTSVAKDSKSRKAKESKVHSGGKSEIKVFLGEVSDAELIGNNLKAENGNSEVGKGIVRIVNGNVSIGGKEVSALSYPIEISASNDIIAFNGKSYRGKFLLHKLSSSKIQIINKLNIEDYLRGVVPCELRVGEVEALKAQAVIARSFALSKIKGGKYDLKATVEDQVYNGIEAEIKRTDKAIKETRGIVCTYRGEVIDARYSSTCGGRTQDGDKPYLESRVCQFCKFSPHYRWKSEHLLSDFGKVRSIRIYKKDKSGRVDMIKIVSNKGTQEIRGTTFRAKFGLKSRFCDIRMKGNKIQVTGKGYGHGIGLCQYGAVGMARKGYKYKSILKYYYKRIKVEKIY